MSGQRIKRRQAHTQFFWLGRIPPHGTLPAEAKIKSCYKQHGTGNCAHPVLSDFRIVPNLLSPVPKLLGHPQDTLVASGALQQVCPGKKSWQKLPLEWMTGPHSHLGLLQLDDIKLF